MPVLDEEAVKRCENDLEGDGDCQVRLALQPERGERTRPAGRNYELAVCFERRVQRLRAIHPTDVSGRRFQTAE